MVIEHSAINTAGRQGRPTVFA